MVHAPVSKEGTNKKEMNMDELKRMIEEGTGIPSGLLSGETAEENIAQAKALLAYHRKCEQERPKTNAEQFEEYLIASGSAVRERDPAGVALETIEQSIKNTVPAFPEIKDNGEIPKEHMPNRKSPQEQFTDWFYGYER